MNSYDQLNKESNPEIEQPASTSSFYWESKLIKKSAAPALVKWGMPAVLQVLLSSAVFTTLTSEIQNQWEIPRTSQLNFDKAPPDAPPRHGPHLSPSL